MILKTSSLYISKVFSLEDEQEKSEDYSWVLKVFRKIRTDFLKFITFMENMFCISLPVNLMFKTWILLEKKVLGFLYF